ncbi:hypothetical protein AXX17_AT5G25350 [Arabidopsis thaliana]|uniref:Uncharacterized protein n=1 Tax=Arabidopsis thaliana TaxID=3702 RepID=A0A178UMT8_ARATH|nr:hypothetical protein AXX17_AT5G25350 [Arabidopsis thaliana]
MKSSSLRAKEESSSVLLIQTEEVNIFRVWRHDMDEALRSLESGDIVNETLMWHRMENPADEKTLGGKWIYKLKKKL